MSDAQHAHYSSRMPLVQRSAFVERGQVIVMSGALFEDGKPRLLVDPATPDGTIELANQEIERRAQLAERAAELVRMWEGVKS